MSLDPVILFFLLGLAAGLMKSDLRLPAAVYELLSVLLLLAIGMKGGMAMSGVPVMQLATALVAVAVMGLLTGLTAFALLALARSLPRSDAASIAAHYGSVSVGTYAVAVAYLDYLGVAYESYIAAFVVVLEVPAILMGIVLARGLKPAGGWPSLANEVFLGKSVVLLLGGMLIGVIAGPSGLEGISPLFFDAFKGILALFLLEMGLIAALQLGPARRHGAFLLAFAVVMPLIGGLIGAVFAWALGLSLGGALLLCTLGASASYIAAPAAMRMAVPEANPGLSLTASLAVTFPFNVLVGIPLYYRILQAVWPHAGA